MFVQEKSIDQKDNTAVRIRSAQQLHPLAAIYSRHSGLQTHYIMVCSSLRDDVTVTHSHTLLTLDHTCKVFVISEYV